MNREEANLNMIDKDTLPEYFRQDLSHMRWTDMAQEVLNILEEKQKLVDALCEILSKHCNDNKRPEAFYIAADALRSLQ